VCSDVKTLRFSRLTADWSIENRTPEVTLCMMLLDVSPKKIQQISTGTSNYYWDVQHITSF